MNDYAYWLAAVVDELGYLPNVHYRTPLRRWFDKGMPPKMAAMFCHALG